MVKSKPTLSPQSSPQQPLHSLQFPALSPTASRAGGGSTIPQKPPEASVVQEFTISGDDLDFLGSLVKPSESMKSGGNNRKGLTSSFDVLLGLDSSAAMEKREDVSTSFTQSILQSTTDNRKEPAKKSSPNLQVIADKLLDTLPDLSFMLSKTLVLSSTALPGTAVPTSPLLVPPPPQSRTSKVTSASLL